MRARTATAVFTITVLGAIALGAASSMSAATDGLSSDSLIAGARMGEAFSGATQRPVDDPDAPIATGRWAENVAPVELAGGPAPVSVATAAPAPEPIQLSRPSARPDAGRFALLEPETPAPANSSLSVPLARMALAPSPAPRAAAPEPRISLTVSNQDFSAPGSGLDVTSAVFNEPLLSFRPSRSPLDIRRLALRVGPTKAVGKKGRWFVFAAGSGQAFGLNLLKDPLRGWKPAGWSVEQLAEFGKAQLGIGWRQGSRQIAASVARRDIGAYGISREDTVVGVSFTVSGKAAPKTRYEQRLPAVH